MSNQFKIFLLVALSFFQSFNLSANNTFFSIENEGNRVCEVAKSGSSFATVTKAIIKQELPTDFLNALKTFGKTEDEILDYFKNYHNIRSGENWLNEIQTLKTQYSNLTNDEIFSLWGYTTNFFYGDLNYWLRTGVNSNLTSEIRLIMNSGINKLPNFSQKFVYRGISIDQVQINNFIASYAQGSPNKIWNDFTSCGGSMNASFASRSDVNVIFKIEHSTGKEITNFADGIKYGNMPAPEIVIKSGSEFEVLSPPIFDNTIQKWIIELKQVQ